MMMMMSMRHKQCLVCYGFEGEAHPVSCRPHGNSKGKQPYSCTMKSTTEKIKSCSTRSSIKDVLTDVTAIPGGITSQKP